MLLSSLINPDSFASIQSFVLSSVSGILFGFIVNSVPWNTPQKRGLSLPVLRRIPKRTLLFLLLMVYAGSSIMAFLTPTSFGQYERVTSLYISAICIVFSLVLILYNYKSTSSTKNHIPWSLLVILFFVALATIVFFNSNNNAFVISFNVVVRRCFLLFYWLLISDMIFIYRLPSLLCFSLAGIAFYALPYTLRLLLVYTLSPGQGLMPSIEIVSFVLVLFIAACFVLLFNGRKSFSLNENLPGAPGEGSEGFNRASCVLLAKEIGLSERETEVMMLLAQGRTLPRISQELVISLNTVQSHTKRIYQKANIHSRQELLDVLESCSSRI